MKSSCLSPLKKLCCWQMRQAEIHLAASTSDVFPDVGGFLSVELLNT